MTLRIERVGTETIRGIEFAIDRGPDAVLVGHCRVEDSVSGLVYAVVESGTDWPDLRRNLHLMLEEVTDDCREESGQEPVFVGQPH